MYTASGFGSRLPAGSYPVMLIVDLSVGFCGPSLPIGSDLDDVVDVTASLANSARSTGIPIAFTTIAIDPANPPLWMTKAPGLTDLAVGRPSVSIDPRLGRHDDEPVFIKQGASALWRTGVEAWFTTTGADMVVICGATTSGCIRATAVDVMQRDIVAWVVRDGVGDREPGVHAASLADIDAKYADVVDSGDVEQLFATRHPSSASS